MSFETSTSLEQEKLLHRLTQRIQRSLPLDDLLIATVTEVREFLDSDRVAIYQFHADESGQVIAESIRGDRLPSLLGLQFPADDISADARELLIESQVRSIVTVASGQIGQSRWQSDEIGFEPIRYCPADPDHLNQLIEMGVQSSLVVPIVSQNELWGLIVSHYIESHDILEREIQTVQWVVDHLSMAITHSTLTRQIRELADREAAIQRISSLLHSLFAIELQAALEETVATLQGSGGRLWIQADPLELQNLPSPKNSITPSNDIRLYTYGVQPNFLGEPPYHMIEQRSVWRTHFQLREAHVWVINDLHHEPSFEDVRSAFSDTSVRGVLMMPLWYRHRLLGYLSIFRETVPEQIHQWLPEEIELAQALGNQFATALQQHEMHQQLQGLNASLEAQVIERTAQLQQATEQLSQAFHHLRNTQSQLIQTEKMSSLGELVAGVAHEINNPVNFIYGNLNHVNDYTHDLLTLVKTYQACYPNPTGEVAEQTEAIDLDFLTEDLPKTLMSMKVGAERIRQIVLSLRNFSRLDQAEMTPVNIHEGLDSTLLILQHRLKAKSDTVDIKLVRDYGDLPVVECYAGQLNQVFMNVINNAIDALEENLNSVNTPTISIRTERLGRNRVAICISDNGRGIPEDLQDKVFETFFTTKPIGKGTGMGLSISHEIVVEKHGGVFKCNSRPGHGTEFWIEIPIHAHQKSSPVK